MIYASSIHYHRAYEETLPIGAPSCRVVYFAELDTQPNLHSVRLSLSPSLSFPTLPVLTRCHQPTD